MQSSRFCLGGQRGGLTSFSSLAIGRGQPGVEGRAAIGQIWWFTMRASDVKFACYERLVSMSRKKESADREGRWKQQWRIQGWCPKYTAPSNSPPLPPIFPLKILNPPKIRPSGRTPTLGQKTKAFCFCFHSIHIWKNLQFWNWSIIFPHEGILSRTKNFPQQYL